MANEVTINVKTKGAKQAKKQFGELQKASGGLKSAALGMGLAFGAAGLARQLGNAVGRAEDVNSAFAITEQIIMQTGSAAGLTAEEVRGLSEESSKLTGIDKVLVAEGDNVLLTFKNLRDEAGAGNDVYSRTHQAMLDMSVVMGTDAKSAAVQLGKALNDPIANLGALGRAGVQFSVDQKKAIKAMVESGDLLGAQKIILKELESQFGGTAEASADDSAKIRNAFLELQEAVGQALLPALAQLTDVVVDLVPLLEKRLAPAFKTAGGRASDFVGIISGLAEGADDLTGTVDGLSGGIGGPLVDAFFDVLNPAGFAIDALGDFGRHVGFLADDAIPNLEGKLDDLTSTQQTWIDTANRTDTSTFVTEVDEAKTAAGFLATELRSVNSALDAMNNFIATTDLPTLTGALRAAGLIGPPRTSGGDRPSPPPPPEAVIDTIFEAQRDGVL